MSKLLLDAILSKETSNLPEVVRYVESHAKGDEERLEALAKLLALMSVAGKGKEANPFQIVYAILSAFEDLEPPPEKQYLRVLWEVILDPEVRSMRDLAYALRDRTPDFDELAKLMFMFGSIMATVIEGADHPLALVYSLLALFYEPEPNPFESL